MRLLRVNIISAETCGGLLDGFEIHFRPALQSPNIKAPFEPLCLLGPNGSGKSQFLQILGEIFQAIFHACLPEHERADGNQELEFEVEYVIYRASSAGYVHVRASRQNAGQRRGIVAIQTLIDNDWIECDLSDTKTHLLLPRNVIGYTSGDNETLSLPFYVSRGEYADRVAKTALNNSQQPIPDTKLILIDYATHLEVLVANLLLGHEEERSYLLRDASLEEIHSFRCIVQLKPKSGPSNGIKLTEELKGYINFLLSCATCYTYDAGTQRYTFDYLVNDQTRNAFRAFWKTSFDLYTSFHKLAMLNDLAIPKRSRQRFKKSYGDKESRRFATRLAEPQDEDKVFRFERVRFIEKSKTTKVDYVSLSDGEHQLVQIFGIFCMLANENILFILDEPESHFNPKWRVKFISKILDMPTHKGKRGQIDLVAQQECLITTHAPFVPSDMAKENVFIFGKRKGKTVVRNPTIETFGTTFDTILAECFEVRPPISEVSRNEIDDLMNSSNVTEIKAGIERLGHSVEKVFLVDHLRQIETQDK